MKTIDWSKVTVALSIRQPWAWLITRPDLVTPANRRWAAEHHHIKDIENRSWNTNFRGPFLIHASKTFQKSERQIVAEFKERFKPAGITIPDEFETGGIVGGAILTDCVTKSNSLWFIGGEEYKYGFVLEHQTAFPFRPLKGRQGFFNVTGDRSVSLVGKEQE